MTRPNEPSKAFATPPVRYRGWECGWDADAAFWGAEGWRAAKGGWDLDCLHTSGRTWTDLLDEIDAEEEFLSAAKEAEYERDNGGTGE